MKKESEVYAKMEKIVDDFSKAAKAKAAKAIEVEPTEEEKAIIDKYAPMVSPLAMIMILGWVLDCEEEIKSLCSQIGVLSKLKDLTK